MHAKVTLINPGFIEQINVNPYIEVRHYGSLPFCGDVTWHNGITRRVWTFDVIALPARRRLDVGNQQYVDVEIQRALVPAPHIIVSLRGSTNETDNPAELQQSPSSQCVCFGMFPIECKACNS